eukprot:3506509-Pleurochrysis_carterae.AAC.1
MADRFLPNETLRKPTTTPACFTDKAQRTSTYTKLALAANESDIAIKQGKPYLELFASILYTSTMTDFDRISPTTRRCYTLHA